ncbi:hypothetical protein [Aeromicrobium sp. NPDC092404]|uniref:hypothetical protein n=1 Tax=Aeromicrobium sp. NPDC092404 TaxID=3154976 RepID=UPI0034456285
MKIVTNRSVQASVVAGVVVLAGLRISDGASWAFAIAAVWAVVTIAAVVQAARS